MIELWGRDEEGPELGCLHSQGDIGGDDIVISSC